MDPFQMHCIEISGTPRERGRSHGEQLRREIQAIFDFGRESLKKAGGPPLETIGAAFQQATGHLQAARKATPELVEEIAGIAEGAGVDFGLLWAFQCQDESYWFSTGLIARFAGSIDPDRCSSLAVAGRDGHPTILAQNLDTPSIYHGAQTLLHIHYQDTEKEAYVVTEPGLIGICGMNNSPLGVCQNTLAMKLKYDPNGVPAMLVARGLIDQLNLAAARQFLHTVPHASGINYMLADTVAIEDYECSSSHIWQFHLEQGDDRLAHTNHPMVNPDRIDAEQMPEGFRQIYQASNESSAHRMTCLDSRFSHEKGPILVDDIKRVLSSHEPPEFPICRHFQPDADPMRGMTNNSLIMVMTRPAEMHITSGPPCSSEYKTFKF